MSKKKPTSSSPYSSSSDDDDIDFDTMQRMGMDKTLYDSDEDDFGFEVTHLKCDIDKTKIPFIKFENDVVNLKNRIKKTREASFDEMYNATKEKLNNMHYNLMRCKVAIPGKEFHAFKTNIETDVPRNKLVHDSLVVMKMNTNSEHEKMPITNGMKGSLMRFVFQTNFKMCFDFSFVDVILFDYKTVSQEINKNRNRMSDNNYDTDDSVESDGYNEKGKQNQESVDMEGEEEENDEEDNEDVIFFGVKRDSKLTYNDVLFSESKYLDYLEQKMPIKQTDYVTNYYILPVDSFKVIKQNQILVCKNLNHPIYKSVIEIDIGKIYDEQLKEDPKRFIISNLVLNNVLSFRKYEPTESMNDKKVKHIDDYYNYPEKYKPGQEKLRKNDHEEMIDYKLYQFHPTTSLIPFPIVIYDDKDFEESKTNRGIEKHKKMVLQLENVLF